LADSRESVFYIEGMVVWDGNPRRIAVDEASTAPLVGMTLLDGYELNVQVRSGGAARLTRVLNRFGGSGRGARFSVPRRASARRRVRVKPRSVG